MINVENTKPASITSLGSIRLATSAEVLARKNLGTGPVCVDIESLVSFINPSGVYSTTEQVIGTYIDGRNVWRRLFYGGSLASNSTYTLTSSYDIDIMINSYGSFSVPNSPNNRYHLPYLLDSSHYVYAALENKNIALKISSYTPTSYYLIVEYVKTS